MLTAFLPWKKSYDKPRQHIKKQRHYFTKKSPYSQSYGFSSSHVWMWELDCKEGWAPKNWCLWNVVLEKTLESPLDCKEIHLVHPKGDQSWVFIGRTNVEAETPVLVPGKFHGWRSLVGCSPWGHWVRHDWATELNWTELTRRTLVGKVMFLLLNMLSRLVITFLPRSKHLLILWLQSPSAVILEPRKIKPVTVSYICLPWSDR